MSKDVRERVEAAAKARAPRRAPCSWAARDVDIAFGLDGVWRVGGRGARHSRAFSGGSPSCLADTGGARFQIRDVLGRRMPTIHQHAGAIQ
eukprot:12589835-Alexandrium_andersonii.AAC.1